MLVLLIVATACGTRGTPTAHDTPTPDATSSPYTPVASAPLLLIGDSIMVGASDYGNLQALLTSTGWIPEVIAETGRGVPWALEQVTQRQTVPRFVLVELGTNPGPPLRDFQAEVGQLVDALTQRGARRILWIPPEARDPLLYAEKAAVISQAASSTVIVSSWPAQLELHPEWFNGEVHLTEQGYAALAEFLRDELVPLHG